MYIKTIQDCDEFSREADIVVSDGKYNLLGYCTFAGTCFVNQLVKEIDAFMALNIMRAKKKCYIVQKTDGYYSYHLCGRVLDIGIPMVEIGDLKILLDTCLPKDIKIGEYIDFDVNRLNCWL